MTGFVQKRNDPRPHIVILVTNYCTLKPVSLDMKYLYTFFCLIFFPWENKNAWFSFDFSRSVAYIFNSRCWIVAESLAFWNVGVYRAGDLASREELKNGTFSHFSQFFWGLLSLPENICPLKTFFCVVWPTYHFYDQNIFILPKAQFF
jgi:hypothetical protein